MNTLIVLNNVKKEYLMGHTTVQALRGVNLSLQKGKYYSIVGPSGSGKSTLLHILGCMDVPSSGEVQINGQQIGGMSERELTSVRARAIVKNPALILADEPTGNLDSKTGTGIIALLRQINQQAGTTIIQVTHDREIAGMSDEIVSLRDGQVCPP